jgi:hypothetical protein
MDCVVASWLFNTISTDLLDVIHDRNGVTTLAAWLGLQEQFQNNSPSIIVGNGVTLPVIGTGYSSISGSFHQRDVLIAPSIIQNLLSVRKFTTDNFVSLEFDPLGVSVKNLRTRATLLRCDSTGPLYTLQLPSSSSTPCALIATPSPTTWHRCLGHPGTAALQHLAQSSLTTIICVMLVNLGAMSASLLVVLLHGHLRTLI